MTDASGNDLLVATMDANSAKIAQLRAQTAHLEQLHDELKSLCVHTAASGVQQSADAASTADELKQRLEITEHDVAAGVKLILNGIAREKARQKLHNVYNSRPVVLNDETREILRQLDRAREELELREAVTAAANRRQQRDATAPPMDETDGDESGNSPTTSRRSRFIENQHKEMLTTRYNWLIGKILAPRTAVRMFQQGVIMQRELEAIQKCTNLSQSAENLIKFIMDQPYAVFQGFKTALKQTKQDDVYLVLADIDCTPNDQHQEVIRKNYVALGEMIDLEYSTILYELCSLGVIDPREMETIKSEVTSYDKNEKLLSLLSRKSTSIFEKFVGALDTTGQGHIADLIRVSLKSIAAERRPKTSPAGIIPYGKPVSGIASLVDKLFVLRKSTRDIEVYHMETLALLQYMPLNTGFDCSTRCLASCAVNNCLYILNCEARTVYKFQIIAKSGGNLSVDGCPTGLSVNSSHNLLITCVKPDKILEYTTRGLLIREVHLHFGADSIFAIQLPSRQFVVCQAGSEHHRVCLVDSNEELIDTFGDTFGSQSSRLNAPKHMLVYKNRYVLVADSGNNRIVVLDKTIRWVCDLVVSVVCEPVTLCLDEARDRLYVGEWSSGRILMFDKLSTLLTDCE